MEGGGEERNPSKGGEEGGAGSCCEPGSEERASKKQIRTVKFSHYNQGKNSCNSDVKSDHQLEL